MIDSPLPKLFGNLFLIFGAAGIVGSLFFHWSMAIVVFISLFIILCFFNRLDEAVWTIPEDDICKNKPNRSNRNKERNNGRKQLYRKHNKHKRN